MNYLNYDGELNFDGFEKFINELKECNQEEDLLLFLTTNGGEYAIAQMIYEALFAYPKKVYVNINFECSSAGFCLLINIIHNDHFMVNIGGSAFSVVHKVAVDYSIAEVKKNSDKAKFWSNRLDFINEHDMKTYKTLGFTDEELDKINNDEDIYLDYNGLKRVLFGVTEID